MQTLNVGAGRSDQDYQASLQQHRADLRSEAKTCAEYFFVAAGLAALSTRLLPFWIDFGTSIGIHELLARYGSPWGPMSPLALRLFGAAWVGVLVAFAFAARRGHRWLFLAGIALYVIDMVALIVMFSMLSFGVHAFLVFKWFHGQKMLKELADVQQTKQSAVASA